MRIVLVAEDRILCDGLRALLGQNSMMEVVGEAHSGPEAVELVLSLRPEVVLIDVGSWTSANMDMIRRVSQMHPQGRIIALPPPSETKPSSPKRFAPESTDTSSSRTASTNCSRRSRRCSPAQRTCAAVSENSFCRSTRSPQTPHGNPPMSV